MATDVDKTAHNARVCVIGPGRVGFALARRHQLAGHKVTLCGRSGGDWQQIAQAAGMQSHVGSDPVGIFDRYLFCVADDQLQQAVDQFQSQLASSLKSTQTPILFAHTSGLHDFRVFQNGLSASHSQLCMAALHPIIVFPAPESMTPIADGFVVSASFQGDSKLAKIAVQTWGGNWLEVESNTERGLYHLALSQCANHLTGLLARAEINLTPALGVQAKKVVHQLASTALQAYAERGAQQALTGPMVRGDLATLQAHLLNVPSEQRALHLQELNHLWQLAQDSGRLLAPAAQKIRDWLDLQLSSPSSE